MWTCPLPLSSFLMSTAESRPQPNHDASDEPRSAAAARWSALVFISILLSPRTGSKQESNRRFGLAADLDQVDDRGDARGPARLLLGGGTLLGAVDTAPQGHPARLGVHLDGQLPQPRVGREPSPHLARQGGVGALDAGLDRILLDLDRLRRGRRVRAGACRRRRRGPRPAAAA